MWLYPFKNYYLKTEMSRSEITNNVLQLTFLSDEGYKSSGEKKYFYGELDPETFHLESIEDAHRLVPYTEAKMRGVEDEMYLFVTLKLFKYRRIYFVIIAFLMISLTLMISDVVKYKAAVLQNPPFYLLTAIILGIILYLVVKCRGFWRTEKNTLDFYRGLFQAEIVKYSDVPVVFKL